MVETASKAGSNPNDPNEAVVPGRTGRNAEELVEEAGERPAIGCDEPGVQAPGSLQ